MNSTMKLFLSVSLFCATHNALAGKWVNWGNIAQDIKEGITSTIDFVSEKLSTSYTTITPSGTVTTKEIAINDIEIVELSGIGNLVITQNDKQNEGLIIEADEAIMPYIEAQISNKTLSLKIKNNTLYQVENKGIVYRANLKKLSHLTLSGATCSELNSIKTDSLTIDLSGASRLSGSIDVQFLMLDASGSSKIILSGSATTQNINVSGASRFDGQDLMGKTATIHGSGSSTLYCNVSEKLSGKVSGSSALYYKNIPSVSVKSTGVASVQKI